MKTPQSIRLSDAHTPQSHIPWGAVTVAVKIPVEQCNSMGGTTFLPNIPINHWGHVHRWFSVWALSFVPASVSVSHFSLSCLFFSCVFGPSWLACNCTCYPLCLCLFVFCALPLLPLSNHHPTCPQFPHFRLPLFLPVPFCRHDSFSLYLFSFIFSCLHRPHSTLPVSLPSFVLCERRTWLWELLEVLMAGLENPWVLSICCIYFVFVFSPFYSFHFLISFHNSVITVLCQPVINGLTEPITGNIAGLCVYGVCLCVRACFQKKDAWSLTFHNS